jgi:5-methylcytosine-specific restriction endonuclease McrA
MCGEHVLAADATLEHIQPLSEGGSSHIDNLAISHGRCNNQRHAKPAHAAQTRRSPD